MFLYFFRFLAVLCWFLFSSLIALVVSLFRPFDVRNAGFFCKLLSPVGLWLSGIKAENRRYKEFLSTPQCVYMANHQSNLDLFIFGPHQYYGRNVTVGKKQIKYLPFFGQVFWLAGHILIDRSNKKGSHEKMDQLVKQLMKIKKNLWIFPEGTRSKGKGLGEFKKGPFRMSIELQLPIYPVVCSSLHKTLDYRKWHAGNILTTMGEPIPTKGLTMDDVDELRNKVKSKMQEMIAELDAELAKEGVPNGKPLQTLKA